MKFLDYSFFFWLIQIKDAGHAVMVQYPDESGKILQTFLSTTSTPAS